MIDEDAQPTRVTVLKGDVRPPPREGGSRLAGERRGLMIGVLVLVVLVLLALMVVGGELVRRAFDQASERGKKRGRARACSGISSR